MKSSGSKITCVVPSRYGGPARWLRWYANARYRSMNYLVAVVIILVFLDTLAAVNARATRAGIGQRVEVTLVDGSAARTALLFGTTGQFLFLFDATTGGSPSTRTRASCRSP